MKTLILIFFIPLIMMGQDTDWGLLTATSQYDSIKGKSDVEFALLRILEEYEAECYADSSLHIWTSSPDVEIEPTIDSLGRKVYDYSMAIFVPAIAVHHRQWVHRESTFKGFIEFLRKKH